ncbi:SDR family NAD(P)-dependent oxidoreductase [Chryseobacterium sp. H3056]|uniref:SDR family NAD(P)-dependent oxidoreductase n=1 Tax=Kaistella daneshvariae TaxID=2487074 RepID=A0A3N0WY65_9FLAO|nr:SDR family NAD(P)-dependent oxidoreductase [Kaistella daneshvariae]ROI10054.1 SDR family NAD(P)-dependent oxidoreductase [Kaistella daneshvariae]
MTEHANKLNGKIIVITGASSGFGRESAIRLAAMGAHLVVCARRTDLLETLQEEIENQGGRILIVTCDVSKPEDVQKLADAAISKFGRIDIWINNVGVGALGYFWDIPIEDHARLIDVNLKGLVYGAHAALRHFVEKGDGVLVNVGSIDSEVPLALQNTYAATKAAVLSLSRTLNEELKLYGKNDIKVATIMPWAVDTPWWVHAANYTGHKPRMTAMDDPDIVIDKIVLACTDPKEEMPVGPKASGSNIFHRMFPDWSEHVTAKISKEESDKGGYAPPTTGSIYSPMKEGTGVEGNIRERMEKEDKNN